MTLEPDRYELKEGPVYRFELNRREWLEAWLNVSKTQC